LKRVIKFFAVVFPQLCIVSWFIEIFAYSSVITKIMMGEERGGRREEAGEQSQERGEKERQG
jgi:hypothetical protein